MATTPPRSNVLHTPPPPLHGARYDTYQPYSTRKSTRHSTPRTRHAVATPLPNSDELHHQPVSSRPPAPHTFSPPSSAHTSPRKKLSGSGRKRDIANMNGEDMPSQAASKLGNGAIANPQSKDLAATSMLPTPAKTPRKKQVHPAAAKAAARVLFPVRPDTVDEAMPIPRKRKNRRRVVFSLYSSKEDEEANAESNIQIYTDSKDKIPELDPSEDNPFLEQPTEILPPPEPSKGRSSRKRKASRSPEERKAISEAFNREEGMVYVFRGKKVYRKFPVDSPSSTSPTSSTNPLRPLTRSTIKPRLLFPTPAQRAERASLETEEATTDIDETLSKHKTGKKAAKKANPKVITPVKQSFTPATPPTTGHAHATRSATKKARMSSSPAGLVSPMFLDKEEDGEKKVSPFDGWARRKAGVDMDGDEESEHLGGGAKARGKGKKREGEAMATAAGGGKRAKNGSTAS